MHAGRRKQLEERRRFMHERTAARAQRQAMEPALSAIPLQADSASGRATMPSAPTAAIVTP